MDETNAEFIPPLGAYKKLKAFQVSECIYDITYYFAHRYLRGGDRTIDQMIQAARSGKQNIAEGSAAAATSKETQLKLTNVAKASLQELLIDYEDYLRVRDLEQWPIDSEKAKQTRIYCISTTILLRTERLSKCAATRLLPTSPSHSFIKQTPCYKG
jgi:four helix bundle protein